MVKMQCTLYVIITLRYSNIKEVCLESLIDRIELQECTFFCKIVKMRSLQYLTCYLKRNMLALLTTQEVQTKLYLKTSEQELEK